MSESSATDLAHPRTNYQSVNRSADQLSWCCCGWQRADAQR